MVRRWGILLAMLALMMGTALFAASASASTVRAVSFRPGGPVHVVTTRQAALAGGVSHQAESTNWSGYAATTGTYTSVSASWTEPAGTCKSGDQYSSLWVGLDGYNSSSVEQTGSDVDCSGKTPRYYAWYETYPNPPVDYSSTVKPGDHFSASVTYTGSNKFSLNIADTTRGWSHTTVGTVAGAARSSAEVVVEAPCCTASGAILPLADFGTMGIASAQANGSAFGNAGGVTQIAMIDNAGRAKDTISSLSAAENFTATWLRGN
jgi:Peptidase A4 family